MTDIFAKSIEIATIEVAKLELAPTDILIVKCPDFYTQSQVQWLCEHIGSMIANPIVVISKDVDIEIANKPTPKTFS